MRAMAMRAMAFGAVRLGLPVLGAAVLGASPLPALASAPPEAIVTGLQAEPGGEGTRLVLSTRGPVSPEPRLLHGGRTLVVDLPSVIWTAGTRGTLQKLGGRGGAGAAPTDGIAWRARTSSRAVRLIVTLAEPASGVRMSVDREVGRRGAATRPVGRAGADPDRRLVLQLATRTSEPVMPSATKDDASGDTPLSTQRAVAARLVFPPLSPLGRSPGFDLGTIPPTSPSAGGGWGFAGLSARLGDDPAWPGAGREEGRPLSWSASTSVLGNPMAMDWGVERGSFNLRMAPDDGDVVFSSRLRFRDKSLTVGVLMPF